MQATFLDSRCSSGGRRDSRDDFESAKPTQPEDIENDKLKKEHLRVYLEIERYKKYTFYSIVIALFSVALAVIMVVWRFTQGEVPYEEMRTRIISPPGEKLRKCTTAYPNALTRTFDTDDVGEALFLTPLLEAGLISEAVDKARVENIMQSTESFAGFLTVRPGSNLFFWFFPATEEPPEGAHPLLLWLQGGPGWSTMYGLFKENGPFLVGWDNDANESFLFPNRHSWTDKHHMLYIDNPVGTGFSFTNETSGYCKTDKEVAVDLIEALRQFMIMLPEMVPEKPKKVYAFGESYGGSYVVALAYQYLEYLKAGDPIVENMTISGIGIGNGFISSEHQSVYADYMTSITYVSKEEYEHLKDLEGQAKGLSEELNTTESYSRVQDMLEYIVLNVTHQTNLYDFTFSGNYLTNHEYVCYLQKEHVRRGIHVGTRAFNKGFQSHQHLEPSISVSKKPWLDAILDSNKIEVIIYNGNLDVIINIAGTSSLVNALNWKNEASFRSSSRNQFWTKNPETDDLELVGYFNSGGGLTMMTVRNAGHMVPISQPLWAREIVYQFTHFKEGSRFKKPKEKKKDVSNAMVHC